jgi:hypothetical protein
VRPADPGRTPTDDEESGTVARRSLVLAVVGATLAAFAPAVALGDVSAEATLADRYAPVVRIVAQEEPCGAGEPYVPVDVDAVLGNDQVALRGPWQESNLVQVAPTASDLAVGLPNYHLDFPGNALQPGCTYEDWQRSFEPVVPTTYAHIRYEAGKTALQYWFFYIYNDFNNKHEGDWEMIQLDFDAPDARAALGVSPAEVGYSQHDGAEQAAWDASKLEKVGGTHPVVYPAEGSHADYYEPALYLGSSAAEGVGCDNTRGPSRELRPAVRLVPGDPAAMVAKFPWLAFYGHWGESHAGFYNGPTGPNTQVKWDQPIAWASTSWRPSAFAVPSGMGDVPRATDLFCQGVAAGSTVLTAAVRGGPAVFLAALVALALVVIAVVRMRWRPSQPFALARRRTLGQILFASVRVYRENPRLYLTIGALFLPVSLIIAGIQQLLFALSGLDVLSDVAGQTNAAVVAAAVGVGLILMPIVLTIVQAMVASSLTYAAEERELLPRTAYAAIKARIRPLIQALAVTALVVVALQLTVIGLPIAVWLLVRWSLFAQCVVLEGLPWAAALRRSHVLVRGHWLHVAWVTLAVVGVALLTGPLIGVVLLLATPLSLAAVNVISGVVYVLTIPYAAIATTYMYYDLRVRDTQREPLVLPAEAVLD